MKHICDICHKNEAIYISSDYRVDYCESCAKELEINKVKWLLDLEEYEIPYEDFESPTSDKIDRAILRVNPALQDPDEFPLLLFVKFENYLNTLSYQELNELAERLNAENKAANEKEIAAAKKASA